MISTAILLAMAMGGHANPDPLAPAHRGMVQCRTPRANKICGTIVVYTPQPDGSYRSLARSRFSNDPDIILETSATVRVENGLVCDRDFAGNIRKSRLTFGIGGPAVPQERSAEFHRQVDPLAARFEGRLVCGRYDKAKDGLMATLIVDGERDPSIGGPFIWVRPEEYRLAPSP